MTTPGRGLAGTLPLWQNKHVLKTFEEKLLIMELGIDAMTQIVSKVLRSDYLGT